MQNYVVVDLEMCDVVKGLRGEYSFGTETIQIGAVLMDDGYNIIDKFVTNVKPEYGWLSGDIEQLTGIHPKDLINAPYFKEALDKFAAWLPDSNIIMVQWSDSDEYQFRCEMAAKKISNDKITSLIENCIDCQQLFAEKMNEKKQYNLYNALIAADIVPEGKAHNGLDDAYNTALLFAKLNREEELVLNPIYANARKEEVHHLNFSLEGLFTGINLAALTA